MTKVAGITPINANLSNWDVLEICVRLMVSQGGKATIDEIYDAVVKAMARTVSGASLSKQGKNTIRGYLGREGKSLAIRSHEGYWTLDTFPTGIESEYLASEGAQKLLEAHLTRERDAVLIPWYKAKRREEASDHKLRCDICDFCYETKYGEVGRDYIECHHTIPVADMQVLGRTETSEKDLILVCADCHRMLHRRERALDWKDLQRRVRESGWSKEKTARPNI